MTLYSPLKNEDQKIRLLELLPGVFNDPICMQLSTERLDDLPPFEALSYVWGHETSASPAIVNGNDMPITSNLDAALRHLRQEHAPRTMWVDAVCINQASIPERSSQVRHMGRIYSSAKSVLIWLGPATEDSDILFGAMDHNMKFADSHTAPIAKLCQRPWFRRVWIVQEVTLASSDPIVHCGHRSISWMSFCSAINRLHSLKKVELMSRAVMKALPMKDSPNQKTAIVDEGADPTVPRYTPAQELVHEFVYRTSYVLKIRDIRNNGRSPFPTQLSRTIRLNATDPRDRIFGLLDICTFSHDPILPDYTQSTATVFSRAMAVTLQEGFVHACAFFPWLPHNEKSSIADLPSWVPDFTVMSTREKLENHQTRLLYPSINFLSEISGKSRSLSTLLTFSPDYTTLTTPGLPLGTISCVTKIDFPTSSSTLRDLLTFFTHVSQFLANFSIDPHAIANVLFSADTADPAFKRIGKKAAAKKFQLLTMERLLNRTEVLYGAASASTSAGSNPHGAVTCELATSTNKATDTFLLTRLKSIYYGGRYLFATDTGRVGLTTREVETGDELVGLFGINLPFVLRRQGNEYVIMQIVRVGDHTWGHEVLNGSAGAEAPSWNELEKAGLKQYNIV